MPEPGTGPRSFVAGEQDEGTRLDVFLAGHCPDLSRSRVRTDLEHDGAVLVDGRPRPAGFRLHAGQRVDFRTTPRAALSAEPQAIELDIVWEDEHLIVVNKPVGMVVHPAVGHPDGTLVNALLHRRGPFTAGGDPLRPGIVHRLDRDTSGLLVAALDENAHRKLAAQLASRRMGRVYLAVSWGRWARDEGQLDGPVARDPRRRQRMAVVTGGRQALTRYRVLEDYDFAQLCRVELATGRTHQIRVHFTHGGHPVVGDPLYGDDARARGVHGPLRRVAEQLAKAAPRQLLHAAELRFDHPVTGTSMTFTAPPPPDFAAALAILRRGVGVEPADGPAGG